MYASQSHDKLFNFGDFSARPESDIGPSTYHAEVNRYEQLVVEFLNQFIQSGGSRLRITGNIRQALTF